jgi:3-oxoacyl-[acyl-carrier protein] reductase
VGSEDANVCISRDARMSRFEGQVAVVTGGAQGIGLAVAEKLARSGARVAIWDLDAALARESAAETGHNSFGLEVDVSDWASVQAARDETLARAGRIDVIVNSAGISGANATVENYPVEHFAEIVAINLIGTFHVNKAVVPNMRAQGYGRIVNIASVAGKEGNPNASAYSASKAGVIGFTKSLGKELAGEDIAVNCVTPAAARTRIFEQMKQEHIDYMLSKIPRGRFLELDEAAAMICWLATKENSFTTGGVFDLSGGRATY